MIKRKEQYNSTNAVVYSHEIRVGFRDTDAMGIVWHGNYLAYFEEGREALGRQHGISYSDIMAHGYTAPVVKSVCEHKKPLRYGDVARIETAFIYTPAAKIIYKYRIFDTDNAIACTGETIQVFLDKEGLLVLTEPEFFKNRKQKMGLL